MKVYRIRRIADGLFSTGGIRISFNKKGKTWMARGHVTSHLAQLSPDKKRQCYTGCEVVAFEYVEVEEDTIDVNLWQEAPSTTAAKKREKELSIQREAKRIEARRLQLQAELAALDN